MMSEVVRYEIKNFITWTLDFENWHKKSGLVRTQRTNDDQTDPGWSGWRWDVEETCPRTDPPNVLQCDLKKMEEY